MNTEKLTIGIIGASGLIGRKVAAVARERGHEVIGFTREPERRGVGWREFTLDAPPDVIGCDAVLNLAGETVLGRWTTAKRRLIRETRVMATRRVVEAIKGCAKPPRIFVNGSATGVYADTGDTETGEDGAHGSEFLSEVCEAWEAEAVEVREIGVKVVLLRTGVVLSREGGALAAMLPAFRLGFGGKFGNGQQWVPWIHIEDEAALAVFAMETEAVEGPLNATAPNPVRNVSFTKELGRALHRPAFFHVPGFALKLAAGGFASELLDSRRIVPTKAEGAGFGFRFPTIIAALEDLIQNG
jgi:hypothetical protein